MPKGTATANLVFAVPAGGKTAKYSVIAPKRIEYSPFDGLAVIGDQDFIAMFGQPHDLNVKMAELQRIVQLAQDKKTPLGFVDLRYKTPYFRTR